MYPCSFFIQNVVAITFSFLGSVLLAIYTTTYSHMYEMLFGKNIFYHLHQTRVYFFFLCSLCSLLSNKYHASHERASIALFHFSFVISLFITIVEAILAPLLLLPSFSGVEIVLFIISQILFLGYIVAYVYSLLVKVKMIPFKRVQTNEECVICFQKNDTIYVQLVCSHVFHKVCIEQWFHEQQCKKTACSCPYCRYEMI